jgi:acetyl esterase/lipase
MRANAVRHGADPERLFVMGHSAGAQLAAHVALNQGLQRKAGLGEGAVDGLIVASGAALDLLDDETYKTEDVRYYERRFGPRDNSAWAAASPVTHIDEEDPPVLVLYATGESAGLQRQARRFFDQLKGVDLEAQLFPVQGESHERMVLVLSHPDKEAANEILHFVLAGPE